MEPKRKQLDEKLVKVFVRFNLKQIRDVVLPLIPDISWDKIRSSIKHYHLKFTTKNIGKLLVFALKAEKYDKVRNILNRLCLLDVALHNSKTWIPLSLSDPVTEVRLNTPEKMEKQVLQAIRIEKLNGNVYATILGELIYVLVIFKKLTRKKGVTLSSPHYFVSSIKEPYVFINNTNMPEEKISIFCKALGFENFRKVGSLSGKNIQSLLLMLNNKTNKVKPPQDIPFVPEVITDDGIVVYLEQEERLKHIDHILGENPVELQEYTVTAPPEFRGDYEPFMEVEVASSMMIKAPNICNFFKRLAEDGMIKQPFPSYIKKFNVSGKNNIKLKLSN